MAATKRLYDFKALTSDNLVLKAIRSIYLPFSAAILSEYFTGSQNRMQTQEFHEQLRADIDIMERSQDFLELNLSEKSPAQWCQFWIFEQHLLARIQDEQDKAEYYQLTSTGQALLSFLDSLTTTRRALTASRLNMLLSGLGELERKTNPDKKYRLELLRKQQKAIAEEIKRTEAGDIHVMSKDLATAELQEYASLAKQVPQDFARVRESFRQIGQNLREQLIDSDLPQEKVLEKVFLGLDTIDESDEGRSFNSFFNLLMDSQLREGFSAAIEGLYERGYLNSLDYSDRNLLLNFIANLSAESFPVQDMMHTISHNLREFVSSRQFVEFHAMAELLNDIQRLGMRLNNQLPLRKSIVDLEGTTAVFGSVGRLELSEPVKTTIEEEVIEQAMPSLDLEVLLAEARKSEIDFATLKSEVNKCVEDYGTVSVKDILDRYPAEQGVASVLGLIMLAERHGKVLSGETEELVWRGMFDQKLRGAVVEKLQFERVIS